MIYPVLVHFHSITRWLLLISLLMSLLLTLFFWLKKKPGVLSLKKIFAMTGGLAHTQLLLGIILYFVSPRVVFSSLAMKDPQIRFYTVEHITMMILAILLITIGMLAGRKIGDELKYTRKVFIYYLAALLLILMAIPWPWGSHAGGWY